MAQVIAILNDKGGVAKTTTTANLGTALWLLGKKVLLVDTDQQCNLTFTLDRSAMGVSSDGKPKTMYEWLMDINRIPVFSRYEGLDFIPSSRDMVNANDYLGNKMGRESYLSKRLELIKNEYDYILIDCAPGGKNLMNTNVLAACNSVIIPAESDIFSIQGAPNLLNFINEVREFTGAPLPILGYLLVKFEANTRMGKEVKNYYNQATETLGGPLFPVQIHKCKDCREAPQEEMTLFEYAPNSTAADNYMMVAERLIGLKTRKKNWSPTTWGKKASDAYKAFINDRNL